MPERCLMTLAAGWLLLAAGPALADCERWDAASLARMTVEELAACLDAGADPKARDELGATPLHWAASNNENPAVIAALLEAGADLKARDKLGRPRVTARPHSMGRPGLTRTRP